MVLKVVKTPVLRLSAIAGTSRFPHVHTFFPIRSVFGIQTLGHIFENSRPISRRNR